MKIFPRNQWLVACVALGLWLGGAVASNAQVRRYEPSRPTVSPYLNLFRERRGVLPNYYTLVRPFERQYETNRMQQQIIDQQSQAVDRLQGEVYDLQQRQATELNMTPTGKSGWFLRPSNRNQFMNTSRYYSQSGSAAAK